MPSEPPARLEPRPDLSEIEARWRDWWEREGIYQWRADGAGDVFSVDTPPPYVSATHLHVGHAMSYAQAEFVVRYQRMRGARIFYPMGFDDNGLPTERFVERKYGIDKARTGRTEFRALCLAETADVAAVYEELWRSLGLSVDWSLRYSTIDDHCRRTAQRAFLELFEMGRIYRTDDPVFWDPRLGTALAQADLEVIERRAWLHDIAFTSPTGDDLVVSTTRPELLAACVALYCHPDDLRYSRFVGGTATTPLFGHAVPVRADTDVDPTFGTGLMMVCTFGDADDVRRWRDDHLPTRLCLDEAGRMNAIAGPYEGLTVDEARARLLVDLEAAGHTRGRVSLPQRVAVSERSGAPVEFAMRPQWFLRLLDMKDELRDRAAGLRWHPEWMRQRLEDWIAGLRYDWNLSRQRYYGVAFPVWFCDECGASHLATGEGLPVDPLEHEPPRARCDCGGSLSGDPDVMDTWFTSSLTPQVLTNWAGSSGRPDPPPLPLSLRVQAHDIIRTWAFYTLLQSHLHRGRIPWRHVMISGWGLNEQGKRISKRDLDPTDPAASSRYDPHVVMARHGVDALRHWAARGGLGHDVRYNEKDIRAGRKHVLKLWNVARFCQPHMTRGDLARVGTLEDRWLLAQVDEAVSTATAAFEGYDYAGARQAADDLLWSFADDWLELAKDRIRHPDRHPAAAGVSARVTMHFSLRQLLALYAPFLPFVTEELFHRLYRAEEDEVSIHLTRWPSSEQWTAPPETEYVLAILRASRMVRTERRIPQSAEVDVVTVDAAEPARQSVLRDMVASIRAAARAEAVVFGPASTPTELSDLRIDLGEPRT